MKAITGRCIIDSLSAEDALVTIAERIRPMRLHHRLEQLAVAAAGNALLDAKINLPVDDSTVGLYVSIDDSIEDIKDEYFRMVLADGLLGGSPLLFPFTSPNALSAQISIACDVRGECIVMSVNGACPDMIKYATGCIDGRHVKKAVAGTIRIRDLELSAEEGRYRAEFVVIEEERDAMKRGAVIYHLSGDENAG